MAKANSQQQNQAAAVHAARAAAQAQAGGRGGRGGRGGGGKPNGGVGNAGSSLLGNAGGGGKGSGPGADATTQTPATPAASTPTVQPFLTPDQQKALDDWNTSYGDSLAKLQQADTAAVAKWTADTGAENLHFAQNNDITNQSEAARGMFQSSIRMNALNDLAVTHAAAINTINTNRDTALNNDQISRGTLGQQNTTEQNYYAGIAVENAQGVTPVTGPNAGVATTAPATSKPPSPTQQPTNTGVAAAGNHTAEQNANAQANASNAAANAANHAAAVSRAAAAPKPPGLATTGLGLKLGPSKLSVGAPR